MKKQTAGLFVLGAAGYAALELLWRGYTHWTMALTGGAVLVSLHRLRERVRGEPPLIRCLCGAACITAAEYVVGCTVNRRWHLPEICGAVGTAVRTGHAAEIMLANGVCRAYNGVGIMPEKEIR